MNSARISREYANQLRDAVALARCVERQDNAGFDAIAKDACNCTLHAVAFLAAWAALDIAEERHSYPATDDVWASFLERIDEAERDLQ